MNKIKLNVGASPIWEKEGWHILDHKIRGGSEMSIMGDASDIPLESCSCKTIFNSHMFEHIPHTKLESILIEINRVLEKDGILRILTPDLKKIAKAYVDRDEDFFKKAKSEDESIRVDLGFGGMFMNFVVSPGQDTALFNRQLTEFISGYAHVYLYDYEMIEIILKRCGFYKIAKKEFCDSEFPDYKEPLHVSGFDPIWQDLNQEFYKKNNLIHYYDEINGKYNINFKITGFDRDPLTSLIVECRKSYDIDKNQYKSLNESNKNYNRYGQSLLKDKRFQLKHKIIKEICRIIDLQVIE
jgi:SAM-dependent methyltransferase